MVLVEDERQWRLIYRYLCKAGCDRRAIKRPHFPAGRGSGEQYVRNNYAHNVKTLRWRSTKAKTFLIVAIDADRETVTLRQRQLEVELRREGIEARADDEPIAHLIPKRNIETWILFLDKAPNIDETTDYRNDRRVEAAINSAAETLFDIARNSSSGPNLLPSLTAAIPELRRIGI